MQYIFQKNVIRKLPSHCSMEKIRETIAYDPLFLRGICDYISSMTDLFAVYEYQRLYGMKIL